MKVEDLKELGFDEKQLKVIFALKNGPMSGPDLEKATELRQPEVAKAVRELRSKGYVQLVRGEKRFKHGAPCKIWGLTKSFEEIIKEIVTKKLTELDRKLKIAVNVLFELGELITDEEKQLCQRLK